MHTLLLILISALLLTSGRTAVSEIRDRFPAQEQDSQPVATAVSNTPEPTATAAAASPTPEATAVQVQATSTPEPTATEPPEPTATPPIETQTPQPTATAQFTATPAASAPACDTSGQVLHGPVSGTVSEGADNSTTVNASGFEVTVTFQNPDWSPWDYGIAFEDAGDGSTDVIAFTSDGLWIHARRDAGQDSGHEVIDGNSLLSLMTGPGDLNEIRLVVEDGTVEVNINESQITTVTLSTPAGEPVLVGPVLGFIGDDMQGSVSYEDFTISCS